MNNLELFKFTLWAKERYPNFTTDPKVYERARREYLKSKKAPA